MTTESISVDKSEGRNQNLLVKRIKMCERLEPILKTNYKELQKIPLLHLIDDQLLADTPASIIGEMIDNELFSVKEKAGLREKRRKLINIKTANKSRIKAMREVEQLSRKIAELRNEKDKLEEEKRDLGQEVERYKFRYLETQPRNNYLPFNNQQLQDMTIGNRLMLQMINYDN